MDANTTPDGCIQADKVGTVGVWAHTCSVVEVCFQRREYSMDLTLNEPSGVRLSPTYSLLPRFVPTAHL